MNEDKDKTAPTNEPDLESIIGEDNTRLISLSEAAEIYDFHPEYLGNLARKGRLQAVKVGNLWVTTQQSMENYIRSRQKRGVYREDIQAKN